MMGYLEKLEFSKDWTKAEDFPTYEPDESQVRADLQLLHNEAKAAINALVDKLESAEFASHLAVSAEGMTATNLAAALAEILATAKAAQAGTIVDGTVTEAKLAAALVQKINSIDVTYSMNAPTANETPETGYQLGKLWLKPEFSIANLASDYALASGADWTGENVTKEASGGKLVFSGTGDSQYGTAKAEFTVPAGHTVRVWLTAEETAGQFASLKAYLGTTEYTLTSGTQLVQDVTAGEDGKITIQVKADWSNTVTAAGGKFTITAFTAVDKAASMLPGCTALTDGNLDALVAAKAPFAEAKTRRELYGQQTAGVWKRLVPDEDQTSDELTVTDPVAGLAGVQTGATLSEVLVAMRNSIGRIEDAINGAPGGYVWNKYAYEQKEVAGRIVSGESDDVPSTGNFRFTVANSVAMNPTTGEITLANPTAASRKPVAGEYFTCKYWMYGGYQDAPGVYHWGADTAIRREQTGYANGQGIWALILDVPKVIGSLEFQGIVTSQTQDAYPADGWVENVKYVSAPKSQLSSVGKCATGSYVGTGLYGASSPNALEFTFVPKTVEILGYSYEYAGKTLFKMAYQNSNSYPLLIGERLGTEYAEGTGFYDGAGHSDAYSNPGYAKKSADGKTIFWYSGDVNMQFNNSGYTYYYRALG